MCKKCQQCDEQSTCKEYVPPHTFYCSICKNSGEARIVFEGKLGAISKLPPGWSELGNDVTFTLCNKCTLGVLDYLGKKEK